MVKLDIKVTISNFTSVLDHLGPSASPLLGFLNANDAKRLLFTSKYISSRVSAYADRWGFKPAAFTVHSNGTMTITTAYRSTRIYKALRPWQNLGFYRSSSRLRPELTHELRITGNHIGQPVLVYCTRSEMLEIYMEAGPFIKARKAQQEQEAAAEAAAAEMACAKAVAAKAAYLAKFTIKAPGPPTYPWAKKPTA